jgi:hypothetical protein
MSRGLTQPGVKSMGARHADGRARRVEQTWFGKMYESEGPLSLFDQKNKIVTANILNLVKYI